MKGCSRNVLLYPGIELSYLTHTAERLSIPHSSLEYVLEINYCKAGEIAWELANGSHIFLNPGDFSLHTMRTCANSTLSFPTGQYSGLTIFVDLQETSIHPPELLHGTGLLKNALRDKFCRNDTATFLAGNDQTEHIFSAFYDQPEHMRLPYQKIKALELLLYLEKIEPAQIRRLTEYQSEQMEIVREIHDWLIQHMEQRITIEELSRQYPINPTTLKTVFKAVYGTSIAAHIKEHRMEQAAKMLRESDRSIAEIAQAVGYDSQSKFTAAFKTVFQLLPKEYRKKQSTAPGAADDGFSEDMG